MSGLSHPLLTSHPPRPAQGLATAELPLPVAPAQSVLLLSLSAFPVLNYWTTSPTAEERASTLLSVELRSRSPIFLETILRVFTVFLVLTELLRKTAHVAERMLSSYVCQLMRPCDKDCGVRVSSQACVVLVTADPTSENHPFYHSRFIEIIFHCWKFTRDEQFSWFSSVCFITLN